MRSIVRNQTLATTINKVFTAKALALVGVTAAGGAAANWIMNYIESNSGCFLKGPNSICKVRASSCCQKEPVEGIEFCDLEATDICNGFDEDKEKSCCRECNCQYHGCLPNETMECQRPTVGEAITHFAQTTASNAFSTFFNIFPFLSYLLYGLVGVVFLWLVFYIFRK